MIEIDRRQLADVQARLGSMRSKAPQVIRRAINKSLTNTQTYTIKKIRERLNLKAKRVKKAFKQNKASNDRLRGVLNCSGRRISLYQFGARQTKKGVTYKIDKSGGRKLVPGGFIAQGGQGGTMLAYSRVWRDGHPPKAKNPTRQYARMPRQYRYGIYVPHGPSIPERMEEDLTEIESYAGDRMRINIQAEIDWMLSR